MKQWANKQSGFTIVELLIVVVVIAILAAITIVAYNGIKNQADVSSLKNGLSQVNKKVLSYAALNADIYPGTLLDAGISAAEAAKYQYTSNNAVNPKVYALTASKSPGSTTSFYMTSSQQSITTGIAPGHNISAWNKPNADTSPAIGPGITIDTNVFRTSTASLRIAAGQTGRALQVSPITGNPGQVVTVSFWIQTDSNWNGTAGNSKIRYSTNPGGSLLTACSYEGVKTTWTFFSCSRTLNSTDSTINVSIGNDGTVGNIWIDDVIVSIQ